MNTPLRDDLAGFLEAPEDPVEGALVVARIINVDADVHWAREELGRLCAEVGECAEAATLAKRLARQGFSGAGRGYFEAESNRLDHVLRTRRGIPISLGVIVLGVARRLGLAATGINFPRHFLVTIGDVLVDPYAMATTTVTSCRKWLKRNDVREENAFEEAAPADIALRMLNNVRIVAHEHGDFAAFLGRFRLPVDDRAELLCFAHGAGGRLARFGSAGDGGLRTRTGAGPRAHAAHRRAPSAAPRSGPPAAQIGGALTAPPTGPRGAFGGC